MWRCALKPSLTDTNVYGWTASPSKLTGTAVYPNYIGDPPWYPKVYPNTAPIVDPVFIPKETQDKIKEFLDKKLKESTKDVSKMEAQKKDDGKLDWSLLPIDAVEEIIKVLEFGSKKYSGWNWTVLYKTRKTFRQACEEAGIDFDSAGTPNLSECTSCNLWLKTTQLIPDLDNNLICPQCLQFYGL